MICFLKHRSFPYVSSTLIAALISLAATILVIPVIAVPQSSVQYSSTPPHDSHLYRLSPIPAGADWTSS
jgi:hypothetical protein